MNLSRMLARSLLLVTVLAAAACAPRKIPGTELDDNDDTRAILDVMEAYRLAVEHRDAQTIINLAHEGFKDDGGSANPDDDLSYKDLYTKLPERFKHWDDIRLEINVRKVEFTEDHEGARATYTFTATFKMPGLTNKAQSESEIKQMIFKRVDARQWKILSGV
jgi:hypothetical protein